MHSGPLPPHPGPQILPRRNGVALYDAPVYPCTTTFRQDNLELTIRSPRIRYVEDHKYVGHPIPVFDGKGSVGGTVTAITPPSVMSSYDLVISFEGTFFWIGPQKEAHSLPLASPLPKRIEHVFLSSKLTISIPTPPIGSPKRHMSLRSALHKTILRRSVKRNRRREVKSLQNSGQDRGAQIHKSTHSFTFQLPNVTDRDIPGTIQVSRLQPGGLRGRWYAEGTQVAYKITAQLCPRLSEGEAQMYGELVAPVIIESKEEAQNYPSPDAWSRVSLTCDQMPPFRSFLFIPQAGAFTRSGTIPFVISFTTSPHFRSLARQIMRGADIHVTLRRILCFDPSLNSPAPIPRTRRPEGIPKLTPRQREQQGSLLERVATNAAEFLSWKRRRRGRPNACPTPETHDSEENEKPLPPLPQGAVRLYEDVIVSLTAEGFKKCAIDRSKRSSLLREATGHNLDDSILLPDGLFKGELKLHNELSNTIDWPGLSLTYFVEAAVTFKGEMLKARHVVRIVEPYKTA